MARLGRVLSAVVVGASAAILPISVHAQADGTPGRETARAATTRVAASTSSPSPTARPARGGTLSGVVSDERGGPVRGAMVSAISLTAMASAVSDPQGRYAIDALPEGEYVVRAHLAGFAASRRESVRVAGPSTVVPQLQLRRIDNVAATSGTTDSTLPARPIVAAGFQLPQAEKADDENGSAQGFPSTFRDGLAPASHQAEHPQER